MSKRGAFGVQCSTSARHGLLLNRSVREDETKTMDEDSYGNVYANIGSPVVDGEPARDEMVIHPYSLIRARSSHCVLTGTSKKEGASTSRASLFGPQSATAEK